MNTITKTRQNEADTPVDESGHRRFIINLISAEGGAPEVRSCEISTARFRSRTSFQQSSKVDDIFVEAVASAIHYCLGKLSGETEVIALPSLAVEIPGLSLAGVHLMASLRPDGTLNIMFRFRMALGGVNRAFKTEIGFDDDFGNETAHLAAAVLADIAIPLLDISLAAELELQNSENDLGRFGKRLTENSHELRFRIELVKRFVEQDRRKTTDPDLVSLTAQRRIALC